MTKFTKFPNMLQSFISFVVLQKYPNTQVLSAGPQMGTD